MGRPSQAEIRIKNFKNQDTLGLLFYVLSLCIYTHLTIKQLLPANVYLIISHCIIFPLPTVTLITAHLHITLHPHCQQLHWLFHTFTSCYTHIANQYTDYCTPSHHATPILPTNTLITVHLDIMPEPFFSRNTLITVHLQITLPSHCHK